MTIYSVKEKIQQRVKFLLHQLNESSDNDFSMDTRHRIEELRRTEEWIDEELILIQKHIESLVIESLGYKSIASKKAILRSISEICKVTSGENSVQTWGKK